MNTVKHFVKISMQKLEIIQRKLAKRINCCLALRHFFSPTLVSLGQWCYIWNHSSYWLNRLNPCDLKQHTTLLTTTLSRLSVYLLLRCSTHWTAHHRTLGSVSRSISCVMIWSNKPVPPSSISWYWSNTSEHFSFYNISDMLSINQKFYTSTLYLVQYKLILDFVALSRDQSSIFGQAEFSLVGWKFEEQKSVLYLFY